MPEFTDKEIERYRIALREALSRSSQRALAREVGMSPTAFSEFLNGLTQPYPKTVQRLRSWFARRAGDVAMPPADIAALLRGLTTSLPRPDDVIAKFLDDVAHEHGLAGRPIPRWVRDTRKIVTHPGADTNGTDA